MNHPHIANDDTGPEVPAQRVIRLMGGIKATAEAANCSKVTVHRWTYPKSRGGTGGIVPRKHHAPLARAARQKGIAFTTEDFMGGVAFDEGEAA